MKLSPEAQKRANQKHAARKLKWAAAKRREQNPGLPPYEPRALRGPSKHPHVPAGHELSGLSTLVDAKGNVDRVWEKTRTAGAAPTPLPAGFDQPSRISIMTRGDGSEVIRWASFDRDEAARAIALQEAIRAHVEEHVRPLPPLDAPARTDEDMLTVYPLGDPHIGMLAWANEVGEHFDVKIAVRELTQCIRNLVARAPASKRAIVCNLGDFFHAQDDKQLTPTAGHKLDVDGRFGKVARIGLDMMVGLVEAALQKHEHVTLRNVPGNHDLGACFWIAETLRREFKNEPRVTVHDAYAPYQCDRFGNTMLVWAHTDGAKIGDVIEISAADWPEIWGETKFRYAHGGHIHSRAMVEGRGMIGENHRTLAGKDAWHGWKGYRSGRSLQAITYHRTWGEDSRVTEGIERVRASIKVAA
jgi:hypothetical protein